MLPGDPKATPFGIKNNCFGSAANSIPIERRHAGLLALANHIRKQRKQTVRPIQATGREKFLGKLARGVDAISCRICLRCVEKTKKLSNGL